MSTIFITGIEGIVGCVLRERLATDHVVTGMDLPDDLASCTDLASRLAGVETVIHLARERMPAGAALPARINPVNVQIDTNVFGAVIEAGVRRLIMASSVHADDFRGPDASSLFKAPGSYHPATPYGAYKLIGEEVGRALAQRFGFEFVALRLGGVTREDSVKCGPGQAATWLSHRDLHGAVAACLAREPVPRRTTVFYVVSDNAQRVHDTSNPFGWEPSDDAAQLCAQRSSSSSARACADAASGCV